MSKISELSDGGALQSTDYLIAVRSGGNVKVQANGNLSLGDLTLDGLSVGTSTQNETLVLGSSDSGSNFLQITNSTTTAADNRGFYIGIDANENARLLQRENADMFFSTNDTTRVQIDANGDISFYEDTGTTAKFFWDASAEALGIGTTSPKTTLNISANNSGQGPILTLENSDTSITTNDVLGQIDFYGNDGSTGGTGQKATIKSIAENSSGTSVGLSFGTSPFPDTTATERLRIDSSGNVGIGTSSPDTALEISSATGTSASLLKLRNSSSALVSNISQVDFEFDNTFSGANVDVQIGAIKTNSGNEESAFFIKTTEGTGAPLERFRVTASGNVGIGTTVPADYGANLAVANTSGNSKITIAASTSGVSALAFADGTTPASARAAGFIHLDHSSNAMQFGIADSERMRIDSSGNLLVGKTTTALADEGHNFNPSGFSFHTRDDGAVAYFNRLNSNGDIALFYKDGTTVGSIGTDGTTTYFAGASKALKLEATRFIPRDSDDTGADATVDLGGSIHRFKDLYRSGSTISTSDRNMKQDERPLTDAEAAVAQACKGLLKAFRFIHAVETDGDGARIHFGIIAQDLQAAFEAEGLDANNYAMFRPSTFTDDEGNEQTRLGVCYENLLAFIIAAL